MNYKDVRNLIPCFSLLEPAVIRVSGVSDVAGSDEGCLSTSVVYIHQYKS